VKRLIITADDFGLAVPVNEAIIEAHRYGVVTTASLMVSAPAAQDAINRARPVPTLKVGLHVVLIEGRPLLPPQDIPDLVDERGEFLMSPTKAGFNFILRPGVREQIEAEIRAQFDAFQRTGFTMDHVNAHNHMHLHPRVLGLILKVGREFGLKAVRLPLEPPLRSWKASRRALIRKIAAGLFLAPWNSWMKIQLRRAGIRSNDHIFGMFDSGAMDLNLILSLIPHLAEGTTEIYFHPATRRSEEIDRTMPGYHHEEEFRALTSPALLGAITRSGIEKIAFSDL